jgi:polyphosphate kinase
VRDVVLRKRVVDEGLRAYLADNVDAWELGSDGVWSKVKRRRGSRARSAQDALLARMRAPEGEP